MKVQEVLGVVGFLCLCLQSSLAFKVCRHGGFWRRIKPFFTKEEPDELNVPCITRLANVQCGGGQTVIEANNSVELLTGISVNVTTTNDDGTVTYQILEIDYKRLRGYNNGKEFGKSLWKWWYEGNEVDESKKLLGDYDQSTKHAILKVGSLTVDFGLPKSKWDNEPMVKIECAGRAFKAFESYPETACGGPDNTEEDLLIVPKKLPADVHRRSIFYRGDYVALANPNVQQKNPLCAEATRIVTAGTCDRLGDKIYMCRPVFTVNNSYKYCLQSAGIDVLTVYVACLRGLCSTDGAPSEDTCNTLQSFYKACRNKAVGAILLMANCSPDTKPALLTTATPPSTTTPSADWYYINYRYGKVQVCKAKDRTVSSGDTHPSGVYAFNTFGSVEITLPCSYKMAQIQCNANPIDIDTDYSLDVDGLAYVSGVTVKIGTTRKDGTLIYQTNKLTLQKLTRYINKGNFNKRLWRWSYTGSERPKQKDRILGYYNQTVKSGVLTYGNLTVTYNFIDPRDSNRTLGGTLLEVTCLDPDFGAKSYPGSMCGGRFDNYRDTNQVLEGRVSRLFSVFDHRVPIQAVMLAVQKVPQKDPMCQEVADMMLDGSCLFLGDKLYECHRMTDFPRSWLPGYGGCIRENNMDPFEVFGACLRAQCGAEGAVRDQSCRILRRVTRLCGDTKFEEPKYDRDRVHMTMADFLSRVNCSRSG